VRKESLLSVGIDVGTTTTQIFVSRLMLENASGSTVVPAIKIAARETVYRGNIFFTPLESETEIDMEAVCGIVAAEYRAAGISGGMVDTGAVIITGESAHKRNAEKVAQLLARFAGDFVVAAAGPALESVLAARGAGADELSVARGSAFNLDIGGGTSNYALYSGGELRESGCFDIGGRLIRVDPAGQIEYIAPKIARLCKWSGIPLRVGRADAAALRRAARAMAEILEMGLGLREKSKAYPEFLTDGRDIAPPPPGACVTFSGGVADVIYRPPGGGDPYRYGDIGLLLGEEIRKSRIPQAFRPESPRETIRATVVGAGAHSTAISGSTIAYSREQLPLRNLPAVNWARRAESALYGDGDTPVAVIIQDMKNPSYQDIQLLAAELCAWHGGRAAEGVPLVAVCENDMAKALGQAIRAVSRGAFPLICLDSVAADSGDYIDIGLPAGDGSALPVVVKTLIFG
jgi:ethanolamine utilization protein EutA